MVYDRSTRGILVYVGRHRTRLAVYFNRAARYVVFCGSGATPRRKLMSKLPDDLFDAYDWTHAAGEINELRALSGDALMQYCAQSAANNAANGDGTVTAGDLDRLHDWLLRSGGTRP